MVAYSRKQASEAVKLIQQHFQLLIDKRVRVAFDGVDITGVLKRVELAKVTDAPFTPDKRTDPETGKLYTPNMVLFVFDHRLLAFVIEDSVFTQSVYGVRVVVGQGYEVIFTSIEE